MSSAILIVDDEADVRGLLRLILEKAGYRVFEAADGESALNFNLTEIDLVFLDYRLPDLDGIELFLRLKNLNPELLVIIMTAYSTVERAVEAMRLGAFHYTTKPLGVEEVRSLAEKALETTRLKREVRAIIAREAAPYSFERIIGDSAAIREVKDILRKVAASPASTVLLFGESGTGKDLAAKAVHYNSQRSMRPFMNITCSALPETLLESELFGHERGAFTDAKQQKKGLLELADGGTVFLDEFSEMPMALQAKLLRFLEEKSFKRLGGGVDIKVDVRVIAATNRNLEAAVEQGVLRKDLYYRLLVLPIHLPPLRLRNGDLPLLAKYFIDNYNQEFRKQVRGVDDAAMQLLNRHTWEGNVREFRNAIERAMLFCENDMLQVEDFPMLNRQAPSWDLYRLPTSGIQFDQLERSLVEQALNMTHQNQTSAAALLGMTRDQIRYRMEKFGIPSLRRTAMGTSG